MSIFEFNEENFRDPKLPHGLTVIDLVPRIACEESLEGYGYLVDNPQDFTTKNGKFEIVKWPVQGWRQLDPNTGDEV